MQERDPRWLVQHRDDGKNVNGWHWEEKNRLEWTKQRLRELLPAIPAAETGNLRISEVTDVVGEVRHCCSCFGWLATVARDSVVLSAHSHRW